MVRYFKNGQVRSRYFTSSFLGHTRAEDLKKQFEEATSDLNMKKLVQLSMDGPNVNWKLYNNINEERRENEQYPGLIDVGSCGLHVVHGAFRTGVTKTKWGIDSVLKAMHFLFHESLAKREDYIQINGTDIFPLPFCGHRWIEDKRVAERALHIWPCITKYVTETIKKPRSKIPTSASFTTLRSAVQDPLTTTRLDFFVSTAATMKPFLQMFQSDAPLLPFITSEIQILMETLMGKFVKREQLLAADTPLKLAKLDVSQTSHHVGASEIDIGFAASNSLSKCTREKTVSQLQALEFRKECATMLATIVSKIQERSPLKYHFARKLASLDPRMMVSKPENATKMFKQVLKRLVDENWKTSSQGDSAMAQYRKFLSEAQKYHQENFSSFRFGEERLDSFLSELLHTHVEYEELWEIVKILLTLSHGQASVERGFSVNKEVLAPNIQETSLTAIRLIHSSMSSEKLQVSDMVITEELLTSCSHASNRYRMHLMDNDKEKQETVKGRKRKVVQEELTSAKKRKDELQKVTKKLIDSADKRAKEAEKKNDVTHMKVLLAESNASRERAEKMKKKHIPAQEKEIEELKQKLKDLD
jgi:hypothetical protein